MRTSIGLVFVLFLATTCYAEVWNQFRGAHAGKLPQVSHPMNWSNTSNIAWAMPVQR